MTDRLAALDEDGLAALLARRGDALLAPQPRTLAELAARLSSPASLALVLQAVPLPCVQVAEAMVASGQPLTHRGLAQFLDDGGDDGDHESAVDSWLAVLDEYGLAWRGLDGAIGYPLGLDELFPDPLGLGPALRTLLVEVPVARMRGILTTLGLPKPPTRRAEVLTEITRVLSDPDLVRGIVETAPRPIAEHLRDWARQDSDPFYALSSFDPDAAQTRMSARNWAAERGLSFGGQWSYDAQMPAEVARALRGPDYHAPFEAVAPEPSLRQLDSVDLGSQAGGSVSHLAELALAFADRVARTPVPALKSGGIGAREIGKLGKALGGSELEIRLVLELCAAVGVLTSAGGNWVLSEQAENWRALGPADQLAPMLQAWWQLPYTPGETREEDGKKVPALSARACHGCLLARQNVVQTLAELGPDVAADPIRLAQRALWRRPFAHVLAQDEDEPFATQLAEAKALGVLAGGALSPIGRSVIEDDPTTLHRLLAESLPAANDTALFGADLTVVVAGAPAPRVSGLLDAAADRESRGAATVWRFSPGSIRRAFDEGYRPEQLLDELGAIASRELPQPLRYLIADIGAQHGNLRVSTALSVVRGEDEALLAQVAADRSLRKLGLRLLAPTVLAADSDTDTVLGALRGAGYLPIGEDDPGPGTPDEPDSPSRQELLRSVREWLSTASPTERAATPKEEPAGPATLAARLLAGPRNATETHSATEQRLHVARALSPEEIRVLAHAIDESTSVGITYRSQSGALTRRVISDPELSGQSILAWCQLRNDERWFRLDRIEEVFPAG